LVQHLRHECFKLNVDRWSIGWTRVVPQERRLRALRSRLLRNPVTAARQLRGQHAVRDHATRVQIRAPIGGRRRVDLLRRHVAHGPARKAGDNLVASVYAHARLKRHSNSNRRGNPRDGERRKAMGDFLPTSAGLAYSGPSLETARLLKHALSKTWPGV
jgi:hypothetical protein